MLDYAAGCCRLPLCGIGRRSGRLSYLQQDCASYCRGVQATPAACVDCRHFMSVGRDSGVNMCSHAQAQAPTETAMWQQKTKGREGTEGVTTC